MKRFLLITLLAGAALFFISTSTTVAHDQHNHHESATVSFEGIYLLKGTLLSGEYLVIHDDERKARGEECIMFYRVKPDNTKELVVSYHCDAVKRSKAKTFTIVAARRYPLATVPEITEIQFAGSSTGHRVP